MKRYGYITGMSLAAALGMASCSVYHDDPVAAVDKEKKDPGGESVWRFSVSAGQKGEGAGTRAVLSNGAYLWTEGDQAGLTVVPAGWTAGSGRPVSIYNMCMTATTASGTGVDHTTFDGGLTQAQFTALLQENTFDYYSYFPYDANVGGAFPTIQFSIPQNLYVRPDEFNPAYAPMVADAVTDKEPVIYLEGQTPPSGESLHFYYEHLLSYAGIEMDVNLLQQKVTSIRITSSGKDLWGKYGYDMSAGAPVSAVYSGGGKSITVNIEGGLDVGVGKVLYVPMPPVDMSGDNMTFEFFGPTPNAYLSKTIKGADFKRGTIHKLFIAPAAEYKGSTPTPVTITKDGYYYVQAWGGNGGSGAGGSLGGAGGTGAAIGGLYYFSRGQTISVQVGGAGTNGSGMTGGRTGGIALGANNVLGNGGAGGAGCEYGNLSNADGNAAGGGGAASGLLRSGTIVLVAGGGGGGGGGSAGNNPSSGGRGGNGGAVNSYGGNGGGKSTNIGYGADRYDGGGGNGSGTGGNGGGANSPAPEGKGGNAYGVNGGNGANGFPNLMSYAGGSGGGGGGGGYTTGGGGGGGGSRGSIGYRAGAGGGGAGGSSYAATMAVKPGGYTVPSNSKPSGRADGYVVVTFIR